MFTIRSKIFWFALYSRLVVIVLSALFNLLISDVNADVFLSPADPDKVVYFADDVVTFLFGGLVKWDAQYFVHIASFGYTYENCLAFFPLYPMTVQAVTSIIYFPLQGFITQYSVVILSAVFINILCFVWSAGILYDLSLEVLKNKELAYKATLLFCINPASIFFSAPYSESMFSYLTFYCMLRIEKRQPLESGVLVGLAGVTRSNGLLNIGFIVYHQLHQIFNFDVSKSFSRNHGSVKKSTFSFFGLLRTTVFTAVAVFISLAPFVSFQAYSYYKFCFLSNHDFPDFIVTHAKSHNYVLPGTGMGSNTSGHWCNVEIPLPYSYVQSHYWNVGFLRYYEWKQIPNFLLALPIAIIILSQTVKFVKQRPWHCLTFGLFPVPVGHDSKPLRKKSIYQECNEAKYPPCLFVYILHAVFLVVFCFLCIHVQVTTRLISSASPVVYWFAAYFFVTCHKENSDNYGVLARQLRKVSSIKSSKEFDSNVESVENLYSRWRVNIITQPPRSRKARLVICYYVIYFVVGTAMFSNFLPWT